MSNYDYLGLKRTNEQLNYKNSIRERDNHTCQLCGGPGRDVDHIIPWYISHVSLPANLRVLCHKCNLIGRRPQYNRRLPLDQWADMIRTELAGA